MEDIKLTLAYSITLYKVLDKILYLRGSDAESPVERQLPFNVKYKLQRNMDVLLKDYLVYETERTSLVKKLGVEEEGRTFVPEDKMEEFKSELLKVIEREVDHSLTKLSPDEVNEIKGDIDISCNEMNLFIALMVEDTELEESLKGTLDSVKELD